MKSVLKLLAVLLLTSASATAQTDHLGTQVSLPNHPRILLLKGEEAAIKRTVESDKTWEKMHGIILAECDALLGEPPIERIQIGRRLLGKSREGLRRIFFLSYAWRMTQQENYLRRAEKELIAISGFSDWNPSHFLDVGEMTMAVAIGYDWLYYGLSEQSRQIIKTAILKNGIEPSLDSKYNNWLNVSNNWNQVCNAGMAYGALAIFEDQPQLARNIINRAISSVVLPMNDYKPDGAYPEGYSYWGYGTSFNVMLISALEKAFGSDYGLAAQSGFLKTAAYLENMTGPTGNAFNYSDSGLAGGLESAMFWFSNKLKDPSLLWVERNHLLNDGANRFVKDRLLPSVMLWSAGVGISSMKEPKELMWVGAGKTPVALMRSSWTDPAAIFLGVKGGSPSMNHAHMDAGSFVMDADGVRWAMDFGMQDYESLESKGVDLWNKKQDSQRWQVFRYNNYTHNTLTINDKMQQVAGDALIISSSKNPAFMNAVTDLTSIYNQSVLKAVRGVALVNKAYVVVRDELETAPAETAVRWTMLTPADVKLVGKNRAELTKDGKKLILEVREPANVELKTWSTAPPHTYDAPNPGTIRVGFEIKVPANSKTALTVLLIPEKAAKTAREKVKPLSAWGK
ncbi:heparinase II/III domain-containing protein [Larkinella terrae]|uniref:Heparinase n=1 Tax=Larkinella terrae TaxID=2025311 RepID=A0A7K0EU35_9BACT|nr:heparinase II/III family protein [Larkinella terrae]MRS65021.1 heparinase [Larkinella terrae]